MKKLFSGIAILGLAVLISCGGSGDNSKKGVFTTVKGLIDSGKCEEALTHFSERVRESVNSRVEKGGDIQDWCNAWKISDEDFQEGLKEIESGDYDSFVQEDGIWKIDDL